MMKSILWIIAICEVVRAAQGMAHVMMIKHDTKARDNAYAEFAKSLNQPDREFVRKMLDEFEKQEKE